MSESNDLFSGPVGALATIAVESTLLGILSVSLTSREYKSITLSIKYIYALKKT